MKQIPKTPFSIRVHNDGTAVLGCTDAETTVTADQLYRIGLRLCEEANQIKIEIDEASEEKLDIYCHRQEECYRDVHGPGGCEGVCVRWILGKLHPLDIQALSRKDKRFQHLRDLGLMDESGKPTELGHKILEAHSE